jgi:hypothetical protein
MSNTAESAAAATAKLPEEFRAGAQYFSAMDCAIYLKEDCSYRVARVSGALSLLLAPYENRVVGVKIKGVMHLAERLLAILDERGARLDEARRVELRALLRMAALSDEFTEQAMSEAEAERRHQLAERAKQFINDEAGNFMLEIPALRIAA